jgi:heme-degrading monooxygenase HmoA
MFVVIFRAKIKQFDDEYSHTAEKLRTLALTHYGCREFISFTEGSDEVAISWWDTEAQIRAWKNAPEHAAAQAKGRSIWYESVSVEVLETVRSYS